MFNSKLTSIIGLRNIKKIVTMVLGDSELLALLKQSDNKYNDDILTKIISLWNFYLWKINVLTNSNFYYDIDFEFYELIFTELYNRKLLLT